MPRGCGCAGNSCGCLVLAGPGVNITGTGNASEPYVVGLQQQQVVTLGPFDVYTVVNLTGQVEGDAVIFMEMNADVRFMFSTTAPVGTRVQVRTMQSFGARLMPMGNMWTQAGLLLGTPPDKYFPVPSNGVAWLDAVKMSNVDWFVHYEQMEF